MRALGTPERHWLRDGQGGWPLKVRGKAWGSLALSTPPVGCPPSSGEDFCAHSLGSVNLCFSLRLALTVFLLLNINHFLNVLAGGGAGS